MKNSHYLHTINNIYHYSSYLISIPKELYYYTDKHTIYNFD